VYTLAERSSLKASVKSGERPTKKLAKAIASLEMCRALKIMKTRKPESEHEADAEAKCEGSRQAE
jgi:hypothetical protein